MDICWSDTCSTSLSIASTTEDGSSNDMCVVDDQLEVFSPPSSARKVGDCKLQMPASDLKGAIEEFNIAAKQFVLNDQTLLKNTTDGSMPRSLLVPQCENVTPEFCHSLYLCCTKRMDTIIEANEQICETEKGRIALHYDIVVKELYVKRSNLALQIDNMRLNLNSCFLAREEIDELLDTADTCIDLSQNDRSFLRKAAVLNTVFQRQKEERSDLQQNIDQLGDRIAALRVEKRRMKAKMQALLRKMDTDREECEKSHHEIFVKLHSLRKRVVDELLEIMQQS